MSDESKVPAPTLARDAVEAAIDALSDADRTAPLDTYVPVSAAPTLAGERVTGATALRRYVFEQMADGNVGLFEGENGGASGIGFTADEALASALYHAKPDRTVADAGELEMLRRDSAMMSQLIGLLLPFAGETFESEGSVDVLKRIIADRAALTSSGGGGTSEVRDCYHLGCECDTLRAEIAAERDMTQALHVAIRNLRAAPSGARVPEGGDDRSAAFAAIQPTFDASTAPAPVAGSEPVAWNRNAAAEVLDAYYAAREAHDEHATRDALDSLSALYASPAPTAASGAEIPQVTACIEAVKEVDWPAGSENASGGWSEGFEDGINAAVAALRALAHQNGGAI